MAIKGCYRFITTHSAASAFTPHAAVQVRFDLPAYAETGGNQFALPYMVELSLVEARGMSDDRRTAFCSCND